MVEVNGERLAEAAHMVGVDDPRVLDAMRTVRRAASLQGCG
jgi:hypothetical protein